MTSLWYNSDTSSKYYNTIEEKLNIDNAIWMLAFNNLFVNLDSYNWSGRNYYNDYPCLYPKIFLQLTEATNNLLKRASP